MKTLLRTVRFAWSKGVFADKPDTVYFSEAELATFTDSSMVTILAGDKDGRIWAKLGMVPDVARALIVSMQKGIAQLGGTSARPLLDIELVALLNEAAFALESAAHLRGLERELLPVAEKLRAKAKEAA